jgi:phage baseplate assembly protein W
MQALDFPFRIQSGSWATTDSYYKIVRNQIIDSAMTNGRERVMRARYGMDAQSFLFIGTDDLRHNDAESLAKERLINMCPRAVIEKVTLYPDSMASSTVRIDILFRPNDYSDPETIELNIVQTGASDA